LSTHYIYFFYPLILRDTSSLYEELFISFNFINYSHLVHILFKIALKFLFKHEDLNSNHVYGVLLNVYISIDFISIYVILIFA